MKTILIIEDDIIFSRSISNWLTRKGFRTECVTTLSAARRFITGKTCDLILADLRLPDGNSISLLEQMNRERCGIPFLIMTNYGQVENAVAAMKLGAVNYLCKPIQPDRLMALLPEIFREPETVPSFYRGESPKAQEMYRLIRLVATTDLSVLLRGASGTGKEHIASEIHAQSHRSKKTYVTVDCGAIPDELAASEFFGHVKGSFTGADSDKSGLFRAADGGTLFMDEIGNLSYKTQMLLLRALQEKRYKPVGSTQEFPFNIRLVAATNENLEDAISEGRFREDLFHRLNEFTLSVPLLRECREDILPLASFFLEQSGCKRESPLQGFDSLARAALQQYSWPGNIRELKNTVNRAGLMAQGPWITATDLNLDLSVKQEEDPALSEEENEKQLLLQTLEKSGNNRSMTAKLLGISRTTLYEKLKKYHIIG